MGKKKSSAQLKREIDLEMEKIRREEASAPVVQRSDSSMESVTRDRVLEPLLGERISRTQPVKITLLDAIGPEDWFLVFTTGRNYGNRAGRILITLGLADDPLAGLAYAIEHGRPVVTHVWVDPDARGRGLSRILFDAYRSQVSRDLVVVGPFTKAGRIAAERAGATIEE